MLYLSCCISDKESGIDLDYDSYQKINNIFFDIKCLTGIEFIHNLDTFKIQFDGGKYTNFISRITNNQFDFYMNLSPKVCGQIAETLGKIISEYNEHKEYVNKHFNKSMKLWIHLFSNDPVLSPNELDALYILLSNASKFNLFINPDYE